MRETETQRNFRKQMKELNRQGLTEYRPSYKTSYSRQFIFIIILIIAIAALASDVFTEYYSTDTTKKISTFNSNRTESNIKNIEKDIIQKNEAIQKQANAQYSLNQVIRSIGQIMEIKNSLVNDLSLDQLIEKEKLIRSTTYDKNCDHLKELVQTVINENYIFKVNREKNLLSNTDVNNHNIKINDLEKEIRYEILDICSKKNITVTTSIDKDGILWYNFETNSINYN